MNILFLSLSYIDKMESSGIYTDLLRCFIANGHHVSVISPAEQYRGINTELIRGEGYEILHVKTGNIQKTKNLIEKGISTVTLEPVFVNAIMKYFSKIKFDLVLYPTPPITLTAPVEFVKRRDGARSYLMLKDIFPQNAVDLGMMSTSGPKAAIYRYFRAKEKKLYAVSDRIGCMSEANVKYLLEHNPEIDPAKVEVCPNAIEVKPLPKTDKEAIRRQYALPLGKKIFVYGGNLGKPQGIPFMMDCIFACRDIEDAFFLVVGDGTERHIVEDFVKTDCPRNLKFIPALPKEKYDELITACDVGLIFLDYRFTIPNFPSRLLSYMQAGLPVLTCTDEASDIGDVVVNGGFGWKCYSNDAGKFAELVKECKDADFNALGKIGFEYLKKEYSINKSICIIKR